MERWSDHCYIHRVTIPTSDTRDATPPSPSKGKYDRDVYLYGLVEVKFRRRRHHPDISISKVHHSLKKLAISHENRRNELANRVRTPTIQRE